MLGALSCLRRLSGLLQPPFSCSEPFLLLQRPARWSCMGPVGPVTGTSVVVVVGSVVVADVVEVAGVAGRPEGSSCSSRRRSSCLSDRRHLVAAARLALSCRRRRPRISPAGSVGPSPSGRLLLRVEAPGKSESPCPRCSPRRPAPCRNRPAHPSLRDLPAKRRCRSYLASFLRLPRAAPSSPPSSLASSLRLPRAAPSSPPSSSAHKTGSA